VRGSDVIDVTDSNLLCVCGVPAFNLEMEMTKLFTSINHRSNDPLLSDLLESLLVAL
jgi:hypothetical protein